MGEAFEKAKSYSDEKLEKLRARLSSHVPENSIAIAFGSYARREASSQSDIDYIVVGPTTDSSPGWMADVENAISAVVSIEPSPNGAFAKYVDRCDMLKNLGGAHETNETLTRRLLLLLEGEWLSNDLEFGKFRRELLERYVRATPRDHQLSLFLLNDIIRYWRTMTVDYMYKTTEDGKPWAIRNIKLVFSRKLMYASGLFSVGMTVDRSEERKIEELDKLFSMPVIERMIAICGSARLSKAIACYELFLERMENPEIRTALKQVDPNDHENRTFRELKNEGHNFTRELLLAFEGTFHSTHPIRRAVIF